MKKVTSKVSMKAGKHQDYKEGTPKKPAQHKGGKVTQHPKKPSTLFAHNTNKKDK